MADPATTLTGSGAVDAAASTIVHPRHGVTKRLGAIIASHWLVDVYSAFLPPLLGVLQIRCHLTNAEAAWLLGIGSLTSGLSQPLAAWLSDRIDSRLFGAVGLAVAAVCLSCIGLADSYATLLPLYVLGMIGSGVYHPIGAASMGQFAEQLSSGRRALGISVFHAAGVFGGVVGSIISTRIAVEPGGFDVLRWLMIPGLLGAIALHALIRRTSHRHHEHRSLRFSDEEIGLRWRAILLLYFSNVIRFTVNMAIIYLFVRWAQAVVSRGRPGMSDSEIALAAAPINGNLNALMLVGMMVGGMTAGALIRAGREKWPMILVPIVFTPTIVLMPFADLLMGYALAIGSGIAFAAMMPVSISVAQRLLPHRTSLASGLMMGGAWALAFLGPRAAEWCMSSAGLSLAATFALTAALLVISSLVCLPLNAGLLRASTRSNGHAVEPGFSTIPPA
jgi:FSR family fosmidomycin resistance protein-like MFS transporter